MTMADDDYQNPYRFRDPPSLPDSREIDRGIVVLVIVTMGVGLGLFWMGWRDWRTFLAMLAVSQLMLWVLVLRARRGEAERQYGRELREWTREQERLGRPGLRIQFALTRRIVLDAFPDRRSRVSLAVGALTLLPILVSVLRRLL